MSVQLQLLEHVLKSQAVPWDYDIYDILVFETCVGRIVFRYGSDQQLKYCGHVGYHIEEEFRGHHYAFQALKVLMTMMNKEKIMITCEKNNIASIKTIEKCHVLSKRLETEVVDEEYQSEDGLYIYEIEVEK